MMFMTAKVDMKKILIALAALTGVIAGIVLIFSNTGSTATAAPGASDNAARVQFLQNYGWQVTTSPVQSGQVKIPDKSSDLFDRYNALQKSQGYDLSQYAGKTVMRYVYAVNNLPGSTDPVYATLLVYKDQIIGGDITDTAPKGTVRGFQMPAAE